MTTETLTYAFGTTPEEVIRERFESCGVECAERMMALAIQATRSTGEQREFAALNIVYGFTDPDDLLTVLDALRVGAGNISEFGHKFTNDCEKLRAEILAALGIKEG